MNYCHTCALNITDYLNNMNRSRNQPVVQTVYSTRRARKPKKNNQNNQQNAYRSSKMPIFPPQSQNLQIYSRVLRFTGGGQSQNIITKRCIFNLLVSIYSTGTVANYGVAQTSVRVKWVKMWGVQDTMSTMSFCWVSPDSPDNLFTDVGNSNRPPKIMATTKGRTLTGFWINPQSNDLDTPLFKLNSSGTITIDLKMQFVLQDWLAVAYNGVKPGTVPPAGTYLYTPPLDNVTVSNTPGTGSLTPLYLNGPGSD